MVLERIRKANDIHLLSEDELPILADELRDVIIEQVSKNGGHLASNLGVIELTIALHRCLNFPEDKLIWDVGHQSYAHKILTGRMEEFHTLRQEGGLSGFPKRRESDCDAFDTGHSSTSISAGLGMVHARQLDQKDYKIVSVIGDGSLTGGLALEALNNCSSLDTNFTMILNDNHMSISENVGGLSKYLAKLRTRTGYNSLKEEISNTLGKIPGIGEELVKTISNSKTALKQLFVPGIFFENFGITYLGPIDGHNIKELTEVIKDASGLDRPVLIHVLTQKGRGYGPAEKHPSRFHGIGPFDRVTGEPVCAEKTMTYTEVFSRSMLRLAQKNSRVTCVTAAMKEGTGLKAFSEKYPERFFDVGIAEEHAITFSAGLAASGYHPFVAIYSSFLQRGFDQLLHDVCMQRLPVTIAVDRAGLVGNDGETHQGVFDLSYLTMIPNLAVFAPKNRYELADALFFAASYDGPMAIRYPRGEATAFLKEHRAPVKLGKAEWIFEGSTVAIAAFGTMVETACKVRELLADICDVSVINMRFAAPLDEEALKRAAAGHKLIVTMEENVLSGGCGEHIAGWMEANAPDTELLAVGIEQGFIAQGSIAGQKKRLGLDAASVAERIRRKLKGISE